VFSGRYKLLKDRSKQIACLKYSSFSFRHYYDNFTQPLTKGNQQMAEDNNRNFARFMASLFADFNPGVLVETVLWVFRAYRAHGFQTTYWAVNLNIWVDIIRKELSEESYDVIYPYYNWLIVNIPIFVKLSDETLSEFSEDSIPKH
jgi:hypothetical protein